MLTLLKTLVISKVEYASVLWSPSDQKNIANLENIQRRFTSKIAIFRQHNEETGLMQCNVDYWKRLETLKLYSLERRRERYMIIYMYKIAIGLVPHLGFKPSISPRTKRTFTPKYKSGAPKIIKTIRFSSFFNKGPRLYNILPNELREAENITIAQKTHVEKFKDKLDKWLELVPDQPTIPTRTRAAQTNSILDQIQNEGRNIQRKWNEIKAKVCKNDQPQTNPSA